MDIPNSKQSNNPLPLRVDKTLKWLEESRDSWRSKAKTAKYSLKKQKLAVKRARTSRDSLQEELAQEKAALNAAKEAIRQKEAENSALRAKLEKVDQHLEESKQRGCSFNE